MANTGERIRTLEMRVERLETWAGPGQNEVLSMNLRALRADVATLRRVQNQHTVLLGTLTRDVAGLKDDVAGLKDDVAGLKVDVAGLKVDVAALKVDVAGLKDDIAAVKADVAGLKGDVTELKIAVQEILRRLPPVSAA
jgi:hypothetical protein